VNSAINRITHQLVELERTVDELSLRERLLIGITTIVAMLAIWQMLFMEPLEKAAAQKRSQIASIEDSTKTANASLEQQVVELAGGSAEQRARVARIEKQIDELNSALGNYAAELIDPSEMALVLEGMLREQQGLQLILIRNLPSETLAATEEEDAMRFYRHGLEIQIEGSFADTLDYLDSIESLPWRLYWQIVELETIEYPVNRIRIEVSTLSLDGEWIGA